MRLSLVRTFSLARTPCGAVAPVANAVYSHSHQGLSRMISSLAAHRVLTAALARRGIGPDSVDAASMAELLTGPVYATLGEVLPKEGLHRQLQALAASLPGSTMPTARDRSRGRRHERGHVRNEPTRDASSAHAEHRTLEWDGAAGAEGIYAAGHDTGHTTAYGTDDDDATQGGAERYLEHDPEDDQGGYDEEAFWRIGREETLAEHASSEEADDGFAGDTVPRGAEDAREDNTVRNALWNEGSSAVPTEPRALARRFAALEHVTSVAAFVVDKDGAPAQEAFHGEELERDTLRALTIGGRALLSAHGALRSYHLQHDRGQVLVFARADLTLVLLARPEFDPTAAYGSWAALLEAR